MAAIHSDECKRDAVRIALTNGLTRRKVAPDLGFGFSTLGKWVRAVSEEAKVPAQDAELLRENERLRKETGKSPRLPAARSRPRAAICTNNSATAGSVTRRNGRRTIPGRIRPRAASPQPPDAPATAARRGSRPDPSRSAWKAMTGPRAPAATKKGIATKVRAIHWAMDQGRTRRHGTSLPQRGDHPRQCAVLAHELVEDGGKAMGESREE